MEPSPEDLAVFESAKEMAPEWPAAEHDTAISDFPGLVEELAVSNSDFSPALDWDTGVWRWYDVRRITSDGFGLRLPFPDLAEAAMAFWHDRPRDEGGGMWKDGNRWGLRLPRLVGHKMWPGLTPWEINDSAAYLPKNTEIEAGAANDSGEHSLSKASVAARQRVQIVQADNTPWQHLRGLRDCGDPDRFRGGEVQPVQVFLGWPAYLLTVAQALPFGGCAQCGAPTLPGRTYCEQIECKRARERERKRRNRPYAKAQIAR